MEVGSRSAGSTRPSADAARPTQRVGGSVATSMREIFSLRFFAAVGAVVGLFFLLSTIFAAREVIDGDGGPAGPMPHRIDFVDQVFSSRNPDFRISDDGLTVGDTEFVIDRTRVLRVVADTPAENHCPAFGQLGACAVVADLLGDGVVWFALVPMGENRTVDFPAIDILEDGYAHLVNGWQLRYAPILDRRCQDAQGLDVEFASYREFRDLLGDDFTAVFSLDTQRLEAVECRVRVPYAPPPVTVPTTVPLPGSSTVPTTSSPNGPVATVPSPGDPAEADDVALARELSAAVIGSMVEDAGQRLQAAGWVVRIDDLDDPTETFTADLRTDRVTLGYRDGVVETVTVG